MSTPLIAGFALLLVYISYLALSRVIQSRRHAQEAARLGCKPLYRAPHKLPLGVDFTYALRKADGNRRVPAFFVDYYESHGRPNTWIQKHAGNDIFITVEPKNIQAMLATQFKDFGLGRTRRPNMFPMLGDGIFTLDGKGW